jgi:membrane protein required for colicin V production
MQDSMAAHFNVFDLLLLVIAGFSMMIGFSRGVIREFFGLVAWGSSAIIALKYGESAQFLLAPWIHEVSILKIASQLLMFIFSLIIFLFIVQWISMVVQNSMAQSIDRSLGMVFGVLRGIGIVCGIYMGSLFFILPSDQPLVVTLSKSHMWLNRGVLFLKPHLPESIRQQALFQKSLQQLNQDEQSAQQLTKELSIPSIAPN